MLSHRYSKLVKVGGVGGVVTVRWLKRKGETKGKREGRTSTCKHKREFGIWKCVQFVYKTCYLGDHQTNGVRFHHLNWQGFVSGEVGKERFRKGARGGGGERA